MSASGEYIRPVRLADQAYEAIRLRIVDRRLGPGEHLSVPALAEELGLSRSPVREAVQRLVAEGLGIEQPHRGAVVVGFTGTELAQAYAVREVLEGLSARLAARAVAGGDSRLVEDLRRLVDQHEAAVRSGVADDVIRADLRFHGRLLQGADNLSLTKALDPLLSRVSVAMRAGDLSTWPASAVREHRRILTAVTAGDEDLAEERAREHIRLVRDRLVRRLA
ncbi:GntR family transcriptional regulator [Nocardioides mangrovicus]|uniref:GntR family transcriptional regulator n=1 Tax=Nocardioides mangrovicus TaxID=2478913 RepID=A0A3L8P723_9ACTN|nr:GntR family transcriptional regulator [Nocardioides mangrovicus]RLV50429.1 GntR family transcriptional regulator [Nocardioides mangrovicus]